jgi:hypothetical protein
MPDELAGLLYTLKNGGTAEDLVVPTEPAYDGPDADAI